MEPGTLSREKSSNLSTLWKYIPHCGILEVRVRRLFKKRTWNRSFQEKYEFDPVVCLSPCDESGQRNVVTPVWSTNLVTGSV